MKVKEKSITATQNPCKMCSPLGASIVFKGVEGAMPLLHGSQGCSTYIRRYCINHYKEPVDIASSNFIETTAIFGGKENLIKAIDNVKYQYNPKLIGIATTCLSETIGDDVPFILQAYKESINVDDGVEIVFVSTPSYSGTHMNGFHGAVYSLVSQLSERRNSSNKVAVFPNFLSCEDIRYLKEIFRDFDLAPVILPDFSETMDGASWSNYQRIPEGGTTVEEIKALGSSLAAFEFGNSLFKIPSAGKYLRDHFKVPLYSMGIPIGIELSDKFFHSLERMSGEPVKRIHSQERGRLLDAYCDGHKYVFEKKAVIFGDEDLVNSLALFLLEIGMIPVICATGAVNSTLKKVIEDRAKEHGHEVVIKEDSDFVDILEEAEKVDPDIIIGNSKGFFVSKNLKKPLLRVGFPIHDRIGASRIMHIGYRGTQQLYDRLVNMLIEHKQNSSDIGYTYI